MRITGVSNLADGITKEALAPLQQLPQPARADEGEAADKEAQFRARMAGVGILHSLSVLQMLAAGGQAGRWPVTTTSGLHLHRLPAAVRPASCQLV